MKPAANPAKALLRQGTELVAPASGKVIALTLALGVILALQPWPDSIRWLVPDFTLMVLLFWHIHAPYRVHIGAAFGLGLLIDAATGLLIGQHALTYSLAAFVALSLQRRLEGFGLLGRAIHIAPIFIGQHLLILTLGALFSRQTADWRYLAAGVTGALLWLPVALFLDRMTGRGSALSVTSAPEDRT